MKQKNKLIFKKNILFAITTIMLVIGGLLIWRFNTQKHSKKTENLVEVFYLPHPPVDPIRQKIKERLKSYPQYQFKDYDLLDGVNQQKIADYHLIGHIPVAIFINGQDTFSIAGKEVTFKNFPKGDAFVPTLEGSWSYDDLEKVLANPNQYKND